MRPVLPGFALLLAACGPQSAPPPNATVELVRSALPAFLEAEDREYPPPGPWLQPVQRALSQGHKDQALQVLRRELQVHPDNGMARMMLAEFLYQDAKFDMARPEYEVILRAGPTFLGSEHALLSYGLCLERLGEREGAREALLAFARMHPEEGTAALSLGSLALDGGRPEEALEHLRRAVSVLEKSPRPDAPRILAAAHARRADAHLQRDELAEARSALEESRRLDPGEAKTHYALYRVLTRLGDTPGAERALRDYERIRGSASYGAPVRDR